MNQCKSNVNILNVRIIRAIWEYLPDEKNFPLIDTLWEFYRYYPFVFYLVLLGLWMSFLIKFVLRNTLWLKTKVIPPKNVWFNWRPDPEGINWYWYAYNANWFPEKLRVISIILIVPKWLQKTMFHTWKLSNNCYLLVSQGLSYKNWLLYICSTIKYKFPSTTRAILTSAHSFHRQFYLQLGPKQGHVRLFRSQILKKGLFCVLINSEIF